MGLIDLVKGDPEKLQGKAIVYSRLKNDPSKGFVLEHEKLFAFYLSINPVDFYEKMKIPPDERSKREEIDRTINKIIESFSELIKKADKNFKYAPLHFYGDVLEVLSEDEILEGDEDIVFVGEFLNPYKCTSAVKTGVDIYMMNLEEQVKDMTPEIDLEKELGIKGTKDVNETRKKTYKDAADPDALKRILLNDYVVPMMDASMSGRKKDYLSIKKELLDYTNGSIFFSSVLDISKTIENNEPQKNKIVQLYLDQIVAVSLEDFKNAARLKKEIEGMKAQKR